MSPEGAALPGTWVILVAAGSGSRFGGPKQFQLLAGRTVLDRSLATARSVAEGVVVVVPGGPGEPPPVPGADAVVAGGATRSGSVRAGLAAVPADVDVIVVHDAARPLAGPELYGAVVAAVAAGADCAVPGLAVPDTVKRVGPDGRVAATLDRAELVLVQTPQAFSAPVLRRAHASGPEATDDAAVVEAAGGRVVVVPGDGRNIKITHPRDLAVAEALLGAPCG